uniref:Odorant receptor n=1 Tax=Athetis lepigone TaxID=1223490 RepID=A0A1B3B766_ATHLE|nr:putative odorant receptor OR30 [Athetis lepigone]
MEELPEVPEEFLMSLLPCFEMLQRASIHVYDLKKCIWKKYFRMSLNVLSLIAFMCALTKYFGEISDGEIQMAELAYVVSVYVVCIQAILKVAIVLLKMKEIRAIILELGSMWRTEDLTEVQISKKNALLKRLKLCRIFIWIDIVESWHYTLAALFETLIRKFILQEECGLLLPFPCSFPFDPTENWIRYIGVYIFETYSIFRIAYFYLGTELLMVTMCSLLATEFTLLQEDLLNIKPGNHSLLKDIIRTHQKLISLADRLDDVFDKVIFVNMTSLSISMCFFGLSAKASHGFLPIAKNLVAAVGVTLPLFNLSYYGEQLREASAGVADAAYNNIWYQGDTNYQKLLWFIMRRSQKPCCLTSMKFSPITLNTFSTVLSTTWSYFSLALSVYEDES